MDSTKTCFWSYKSTVSIKTSRSLSQMLRLRSTASDLARSFLYQLSMILFLHMSQLTERMELWVLAVKWGSGRWSSASLRMMICLQLTRRFCYDLLHKVIRQIHNRVIHKIKLIPMIQIRISRKTISQTQRPRRPMSEVSLSSMNQSNLEKK